MALGAAACAVFPTARPDPQPTCMEVIALTDDGGSLIREASGATRYLLKLPGERRVLVTDSADAGMSAAERYLIAEGPLPLSTLLGLPDASVAVRTDEDR